MRRRSIRGQSLVEFALILPVFFALIFAVIDVSRGILLFNLLSNVARDGARYEIVQAVTTAGACSSTQVTQSRLDSAAKVAAGPLASGITVSASSACATDTYGTYYVVSAAGSFQPLTTVVVGNTPLNLTASSKQYVYLP